MGVVYEAIDTRNNARIALKVLLPHAAEEQDGLLRFKREFRALLVGSPGDAPGQRTLVGDADDQASATGQQPAGGSRSRWGIGGR